MPVQRRANWYFLAKPAWSSFDTGTFKIRIETKKLVLKNAPLPRIKIKTFLDLLAQN
jgi:hypothetical protein